jgi:2-phospho-L-lactate guanylyltransferase
VQTEVSRLALPPRQQPTIIEEGAHSSLNLALEVGLSAIARKSTGPTAIVAADLPAAGADDFDRVLTAALGVVQGAVPDAQEAGTTLLSATSLDALSPQFGEGSLTRHLAHGAVRLEANARLRLDVDTPADLRRAVALGVGRHTMRCLLALRRAASE